jgi:hypothetical protein
MADRPLQAVDPGFDSGIPCDFPLHFQPVFQAYFFPNSGQ